ncbi:MAG: hypothetical protein ABSG36_02715 [Acidimicrobiales bacterium]
MKRVVSFALPGVVLLALAVVLVLTNTTTLVITLAVVALVISELCRRGLAAEGQGHTTREGFR